MAKRHRQPDAVCGIDSGAKKPTTAAAAVPHKRGRTYSSSSSSSSDPGNVSDAEEHKSTEEHMDATFDTKPDVAPHRHLATEKKATLHTGDGSSDDEVDSDDDIEADNSTSSEHAPTAVRGHRFSDDDDDSDDEGEYDKDVSRDDNDDGMNAMDADEDEENDVDEDEDEDEDESDVDNTPDKGQITVDFGVYDLEPHHTNAIMHLLDQFCPDHMNEIDRDTLASALLASPYSCVVRVNDEESGKVSDDDDGKDEDDNEEEAELFGLASLLDVVHSRVSHRRAMTPLLDMLRSQVWRTAAVGLSPLDVLLSTTPSAHAAAGQSTTRTTRATESKSDIDAVAADSTKRTTTGSDDAGDAKCVLLLSEYIRTVPLELTVQILDDLITRLGQDSKRRIRRAAAVAGAVQNERSGREDDDGESASDDSDEASGPFASASAVRATFPCMYAVMAKMQRAVHPPVTLVPPTSSPGGQEAHKSTRVGNKGRHVDDNSSRTESVSRAKRKQRTTPPPASVEESAANSAASGGAGADVLDMSAYVFWHEEDGVLYEFRDKRVAALVYRCRAQYDGQPEQELPLSVLFVVQHGAMLQAIAEMRKRATVHADVVRFSTR